jgi:hypothetical protein
MCVIIVKPRGIEMPSKDLLEKCWAENSHGAGFSVSREGATQTMVEKGFLTFKTFYSYLYKYVQSKEDLVAMHFRWATHGYRSAEHTHPFPISKHKSVLEQTKYTTSAVVFHNGIILLKKQPKTWSDTMYYVGGVLAYMNPIDTDKIIKQTKGSRICLIQDGVASMLGDGWEKEGDLWFSNLHWKVSKRRLVTYPAESAFSGMSDADWNKRMRRIDRFSRTSQLKKPYEN